MAPAEARTLEYGATFVSYETLILIILGGGLTLYALLGGADFGGGVWTLLATGPAKQQQREAIARALAPVWEANHVWIIFVVTGLFAAFPRAFAVLSDALYIPFSLALAGIVFRGAAFAFRSHGDSRSAWQQTWTATFGIASLLSPLAFGAAAGAIASGRLRPDGSGQWLTPLAGITALLALCVCAYLAAAYLAVEAADSGDRVLEDAFRLRALASGIVAGVLATVGLAIVRSSSKTLWHGMLHRGLAFAIISAAGGLIALVTVRARRYRIGRIAAATAVGGILGGWGASQWPFIIPPSVSIHSSAAPTPALRAIAIGLVIGGALLVPSLALLFRIFKRK
ncbi:MAG: cytochrome d ubiquinol oxidase subunit II [Actinomycetota bacterium]